MIKKLITALNITLRQINVAPRTVLLFSVIVAVVGSLGLTIGNRSNGSGSKQSFYYTAKLTALGPSHEKGDYLVLQKIDVDVPIIIDVDGSNKKQYFEALKKGVAQMKNTAKPGENGNVFIFGHSSGLQNYGDFKAIFARLNDLEKNDEVTIYSDGKRYDYIVDDKKIVVPTYTEATLQRKNEKKLTLMTCWPIGTNAKRLIVVAYLKK